MLQQASLAKAIVLVVCSNGWSKSLQPLGADLTIFALESEIVLAAQSLVGINLIGSIQRYIVTTDSQQVVGYLHVIDRHFEGNICFLFHTVASFFI